MNGIADIPVGGGYDDRHVGTGILDPAEQGHPVHSGHPEVQHHGIHGPILQDRLSGPPLGRRKTSDALGLQESLQGYQEVRLVIHKQDLHRAPLYFVRSLHRETGLIYLIS